MWFKTCASDLCQRQDLMPAVSREDVFSGESYREEREAGQGRGGHWAKV